MKWKKILQYSREIKNGMREIHEIKEDINGIKTTLGRIEKRQLGGGKIENINEAEFKVFSQWGEDGIIQYLINSVKIPNKIFIEFGVQNYEESNTRFLLINDNWKGLILDGNKEDIEYIKKESIYWRYNIKAECLFITKENINEAFLRNGLQGDIGLLSVDIDGNDYWIWDAITAVNPRIVICEYNSIWGSKLKVTTPYKEDFVRENYHYSFLAYGASINALNDLAVRKGYSLVAGNEAGNNVFFVRDDVLVESGIQKCSVENAYRESQFREGRDKEGKLTFTSMAERRKEIAGVQVYDLEKKQIYSFDSEIFI